MKADHYALDMGNRRPRDRYGRPLPAGSRDELGQAGKRREIVASASNACRTGITLFNERRFFEAHEYFEHAWKSDDVDDRDRRFWKGVTQLAIGCCHAQRENARGALALLDRAAGNLKGFASPRGGLDSTALIPMARGIADQIRRHGASAGLDFPQFPSSGC